MLATRHDRNAVERRLGGAGRLPNLSTPRVSAERTLVGKLLVVFVALVPAAWQRRWTHGGDLDGGHASRDLLDEAGVTGHHAQEGHRPRVHKVTGRQRDIFGTFDVEWQCEGVLPVRSTSSGSVVGTATRP